MLMRLNNNPNEKVRLYTCRGESSIQSYQHERINGGGGKILPSGYGNQIDLALIKIRKATGLIRVER